MSRICTVCGCGNGKHGRECPCIKNSDSVNHPAHYSVGKIEVIDAIEEWKLGFSLGNVVKYAARADHKGNRLEDLKKARWYLDREIGRTGKV